MWESSVPISNDNTNQTFVTTKHFNEQLMNSYGNIPSEQIQNQGFQACRSIINRFDNHSSDDEQVVSDEDDDDQGGLTPKSSKRKGPNSFVLQLNVQNIHLAANAPLVKIKLIFLLSHRMSE
jgi:hypothetical protein